MKGVQAEMEIESGTLVLLMILMAALLALVVLKSVQFFTALRSNLQYLTLEMQRAADEAEYRYWRRELRCQYLRLLPFVTEKNVAAVYRRVFHRARHAAKEKQRDGLYTLLTPSLIGAVLSAVCLCGTTLAWFNASSTSGVTSLQTATYTVAVSVKGETGGPVAPTTAAGVHSVRLSADDRYTVTLTPNGTAAKGYCHIQLSENSYYTAPLDAPFTLTVEAHEAGALEITPQWGTFSGRDEETTLTSGATLSLGTASAPQAPIALAPPTEEPADTETTTTTKAATTTTTTDAPSQTEASSTPTEAATPGSTATATTTAPSEAENAASK